MPPFEATVDRAIDGDSVVVRKVCGSEERVRVGGVDVLSRGDEAIAGEQVIIESWQGRHVTVRPTAGYRVHSEIPAIVLDAHGNNLGMELLEY